ncbi:Single-stranded-DNA-specific exonuclease RecJ [Candidatus Syntrophocurvum alkaliphilum]|uniref:Single-stranded-DNA-specific exonuclease RecJ n=1 Tax=Candidatus Syntrophocurvum alkaliphilum TaxID=2293317 RepID=A0A6I6DF97_9FIRM|nr:single-stranded-DNA-specific exonuclease RecJ [Candidatus Syntrophocurvum alkaliphilum]QGT99111.1 Single-stranded-DNA-specific exonuclease RecJ [Candidatus Syntrophocurvum alkaliphilum]
MNFEHIWNLRKNNRDAAESLSKKLNISSTLASLLIHRGITKEKDAQMFLYGTIENLSDPLLLSGIQEAVKRIENAIRNKEKVVIYGDYDVDGVCSIVLLKECFRLLGHEVDYYVPNRFTEGYGLNIEAIRHLNDQKYELIITVDCGISSLQEVELANELGIDVIITDHHTPSEILPEALSIINPKLDNEQKEVVDLAGVGVAYYLARALCKNKVSDEELYRWLDLVALATVADIVPLLRDNRLLVKAGLNVMQDTNRVGLKALIDKCGLTDKVLTSWHIGFILAPRLNSAGRLENAKTSIELLLCDDYEKAKFIADNLCTMNNNRKTIEEQIYKEAVFRINNNVDLENEPAIILADDNWHHGVLGIVASRLVDRFNLPTILISWEGEEGKGSGRSVNNINLHSSLAMCSEHLEKYGGHKMAVGLSIKKVKFNVFKQKIYSIIDESRSEDQKYKTIDIDAELNTEQITPQLIDEIRLLEPFGEKNSFPIFVLRNTEVYDQDLVGKNKEHIKFKIGLNKVDGIGFYKAEFHSLPTHLTTVDIVGELNENEFRGNKNIQIKVLDMKSSYIPDGFNYTKVNQIIENTVNEIDNGSPVLYVYPTYRSLLKHKHLWKNYLRSNKLIELHGNTTYYSRKRTEEQLVNEEPKVFLTTTAYLEYYLKKRQLPSVLKYLVFIWQKVDLDKWLNLQKRYKIDTIDFPLANFSWQPKKPLIEPTNYTIIYANRSNTISKIKEKFKNVNIEAGVKENLKRKVIRQRFISSQPSILLVDGSYTDKTIETKNIKEIFLANAPFGEYELMSVADQMCATSEMEVVVLFSDNEVNLNKNYLNRKYPNHDLVKNALSYFKYRSDLLINEDKDSLAQKMANYMKCDFTVFDLIPILNILMDLGLCHVEKNGSIISIKFFKSVEAVLNLYDSPYYLEGIAEKEAFCKFEKVLNNVIKWCD